MLGTLAHDKGENVPLDQMPELERLMLHRLSELDCRAGAGELRCLRFQAYRSDLTRFHGGRALGVLFRHPQGRALLRCAIEPSAARPRSRQCGICSNASVKWLSPLLPFTTEEAWLDLHPQVQSVHFDAVFPMFRWPGATMRWLKSGVRSSRYAAL